MKKRGLRKNFGGESADWFCGMIVFDCAFLVLMWLFFAEEKFFEVVPCLPK